MFSMTGYGKGIEQKADRELVVELKSVNHRFLDVNIKLPRVFVAYEDAIRKELSQNVSRGHVDVFVNYTNRSQIDKEIEVDYNLAESLVKAAVGFEETFGIENDFKVNALMRNSDVVSYKTADEDEELIKEMITNAVSQACVELNKMRELEGNKLKDVVLERIDYVEKLVEEIKALAPTVANEYKTKLSERISEALLGVEIDQARLANEVAFFVDKSNIDEEIDRLFSHISQTKKLLVSDEKNSGKRLDFLIQEFNREANTICSKANNAKVTSVGLELKNEIEKIREQVQNVE